MLCGLAADWALTEQLIEEDATDSKQASAIRLYSKIAEPSGAINRYLRFEAGISPRVREIAILSTAREMDSQFEWVAHEPEALKEGVPANVIDLIQYRGTTAGA